MSSDAPQELVIATVSDIEDQNPHKRPPAAAAAAAAASTGYSKYTPTQSAGVDTQWSSLGSDAMLARVADRIAPNQAAAAGAAGGTPGDDPASHLRFDDSVYKLIRRRESMRFPLPKFLACCSCCRDEDGEAAFVINPDRWFVVLMLLFIAPFLWSICSPILTLHPPAEVYMTKCRLGNFTQMMIQGQFDLLKNQTSANLTLTECVLCNGGDSVVYTGTVDRRRAFQNVLVERMSFFAFLLYAPFTILGTYRQLSYRSKRNELMLAYGLFLIPVKFRLMSFRSISFLMAVISILAIVAYISIISADLLQQYQHEMRLNNGLTSPYRDPVDDGARFSVCAEGKWAGYPIAFAVGNFDTSYSRFLTPQFLLSSILVFFPVILKLKNAMFTPMIAVKAEDILHFAANGGVRTNDRSGKNNANDAVAEAVAGVEDDIQGQQQQQQQPQEQHRFPVPFLARVRAIEEADFNRAVSIYQTKVEGAADNCWSMMTLPKHLSFGSTWATALSDVQMCYRIALLVQEQRLDKEARFAAGRLTEEEAGMVSAGRLYWDREAAIELVNWRLYGGPEPSAVEESGGPTSKATNAGEALIKSFKNRKRRKPKNDPGLF